MKRIFLAANTAIDFGEHQIQTPACPTIASGNYIWHTVGVRCDRSPGPEVAASIIKGSNSDPSKNVGWDFRNGTVYKITGTPRDASSSGNCYFRTRVAIRVSYYVNNYCGVYPEYAGHPTSWPEKLWYSPFYPTNEWFWACIVSKAPQAAPDQIVNCMVGFPLLYDILLLDPLVRIPQSVEATGLPAGLSLIYTSDQPIEKNEFGVHYPGGVNPRLVGTPTTAGIYNATITTRNPIGSTSTSLRIIVDQMPTNFTAIGDKGAASFFAGSAAVDAVYLGGTKIFP